MNQSEHTSPKCCRVFLQVSAAAEKEQDGSNFGQGCWSENCGLEDLKLMEQPIAVQERGSVGLRAADALEMSEIEQCVE